MFTGPGGTSARPGRREAEMEKRELTAQERAALAAYLVLQRPQTTAAVALRCGLEHDGAWRMLCKISRVLPIYFDRGAWRVCK